MSAIYVSAVRKMTHLRRSTFKALEELALAADDDGRTGEMSNKDLGDRMHYSPTTGKRRGNELVALGLVAKLPNILSTVECAGKTIKRYAKNCYQLLFEPDRPRFASARTFTMASWSFFAWLLDKMAQISQNPKREKDLRKREKRVERPPGAPLPDRETQARDNLEGIRTLISALGLSMTLPQGGAP